MANITGVNPPVLSDTDYVDKIKNSLDAIDVHDHTPGKGVALPAGSLAAGAIDNDDINAAAAIARSKLASGTASHVVVNDGTGVMSSEAQLDKTRGGTGISSTATFPASGTVVTRDAVETLTNKTLTGNTAVNLVSGAATVTLPTTTGTLATLANAETLSNKTLTAPVVNDGVFNVLNATDQGSTPSSPSAGTTKVYSKTDGKVYKLTSAGVEQELGAGAGGGSINYISANPDAETGTTGYATYKDAAAALPVDGTGGSPTLTLTRTTSGPLRGTGSFLITTTAANLQGEGASYDFTLSTADQAKVMSISFDYNIASGTYVTGDMAVYIYDVTNALVIQPAGYQIQAVGSTLPNKHIATFQTSSNSTSYRLIFHRAVSTASASTMKIDNVQVGPQVVQYGAPVTDWVAWTPTGSWSTNTTYTGFKRRVGDTFEYQVRVALAGAPTAASLTVNLAETMDTAKIASAQIPATLGTATVNDSGAGYSHGIVAYSSSTSVTVFITKVTDTNDSTELRQVSQIFPQTFASGDFITMMFKAPIQGISSTVQMSNDTDTRVVALTASNGSGQATSNNTWTTHALTVSQDTHGGFLTDTYTVQVPGFYNIFAQARFSSNGTGDRGIRIQVNGADVSTAFFRQGGGFGDTVTSSAIQMLSVGQTVRFQVFQTSGGALSTTADGTANRLTINRLSGPSAIAASETVAVLYNGTPTGSLGAAYNITTFPTRVKDSHGIYSSGTATIPVSGTYNIGASIDLTAVETTNTKAGTIAIHVNGVEVYAGFQNGVTGRSVSNLVVNTSSIPLNAGDLVTIRTKSAGSSLAYNSGVVNYFYITRVGN